MTTTLPQPAASGAPDPEAIREVWEDAPGIPGFFGTVDHKRIGIRYLVTSFVFFVISGIFALVMRIQLTTPNESVLSPEAKSTLPERVITTPRASCRRPRTGLASSARSKLSRTTT